MCLKYLILSIIKNCLEKVKRIKNPVPKFHTITLENINKLEKIINEVGFPLIVKNTSSSGSRGTKIFHDYDLEGIKTVAMEAMKVSRSSKALIESLWTGTEHTVETLYDVNGEFHECFITDRIFDMSKGYALETGLVHPTRLPEEKQKMMFDLAKQVSSSIGISIGAAKFDVIMTNDGPRIIEMTVRLSGGFDCQFLVPAATGKNVLRAAIYTALGKPFQKSILENKYNKVCLSESLWPSPGKITKISGINNAKKIPGCEFIFFRYKEGDIVEEYTDCTKRVCFLIVSGKNYDDAKENMEKIKKEIVIETQRA